MTCCCTFILKPCIRCGFQEVSHEDSECRVHRLLFVKALKKRAWMALLCVSNSSSSVYSECWSTVLLSLKCLIGFVM